MLFYTCPHLSKTQQVSAGLLKWKILSNVTSCSPCLFTFIWSKSFNCQSTEVSEFKAFKSTHVVEVPETSVHCDDVFTVSGLTSLTSPCQSLSLLRDGSMVPPRCDKITPKTTTTVRGRQQSRAVTGSAPDRACHRGVCVVITDILHPNGLAERGTRPASLPPVSTSPSRHGAFGDSS